MFLGRFWDGRSPTFQKASFSLFHMAGVAGAIAGMRRVQQNRAHNAAQQRQYERPMVSVAPAEYIYNGMLRHVIYEALPQPEEDVEARIMRQRAQADYELLVSLPTHKWSETESSEECAICLCAFAFGDKVKTLPCPGRHQFHARCVRACFQHKQSCPVCRFECTSSTGTRPAALVGASATQTPELDLQAVMRSAEGRRRMLDFAATQYNDENVLFYLALQRYKAESDETARADIGRRILENFIAIGAESEVALPVRVSQRYRGHRNDTPFTVGLFDEAEAETWKLLEETLAQYQQSADADLLLAQHPELGLIVRNL